jgi:hypothetical protein
VRRRLIIVLLLIVLAGVAVRIAGVRAPPRPARQGLPALVFTPVPLPPRAVLAQHLGAFELEGAWALTGGIKGFGSYSALLAMPGGRLLAFDDGGGWIGFSPPGAPAGPVTHGLAFPRNWRISDVEAATRDPATGEVWLGREGLNALSRHAPNLRLLKSVRPRAMAGWGSNSGPEALVRLADGRFLVLEEGRIGLPALVSHQALRFAGDPTLGGKPTAFTFEGPADFAPTDMAQLPDGRVLILMRRLVWPLPRRFAGQLLVADPAQIRAGGAWRGRAVASLTSTLPVDNFEGLAIEPRSDGRVTVWLMSDDNNVASQRTLLWKLVVDPTRLR